MRKKQNIERARLNQEKIDYFANHNHALKFVILTCSERQICGSHLFGWCRGSVFIWRCRDFQSCLLPLPPDLPFLPSCSFQFTGTNININCAKTMILTTCSKTTLPVGAAYLLTYIYYSGNPFWLCKRWFCILPVYHLSLFKQLFETNGNALSFVAIQSVKFSPQVLLRLWLLLEISWRVDCGVCAVCRWVPQWSPSTDRKPPLLLRQPFKTSHNWMFSKCMIFVSFSDVTTSTSQQVWKLGPNKKIKCSYILFIWWLTKKPIFALISFSSDYSLLKTYAHIWFLESKAPK